MPLLLVTVRSPALEAVAVALLLLLLPLLLGSAPAMPGRGCGGREGFALSRLLGREGLLPLPFFLPVLLLVEVAEEAEAAAEGEESGENSLGKGIGGRPVLREVVCCGWVGWLID